VNKHRLDADSTDQRPAAGVPTLPQRPISRGSAANAPGPANAPTVSVVIPTRNEKGNIRPTIERMPTLGSHMELIFVDGDSSDGTLDEIERCREEFQGVKDIKLIHQIPPSSGAGKKMLRLGKGDAVRKGFALARGDILMILDGDLTVPPEDLRNFYLAIVESRGEFINGNRFFYPLDRRSMPFLNAWANRIFGYLFTWLIGQSINDTLCGTKVFSRAAYEKIAERRGHFGDMDPFGDFDLLLGAAQVNLRIIDMPVRYQPRTYGHSKVQRFNHGASLLKIVWLVRKKLRLI